MPRNWEDHIQGEERAQISKFIGHITEEVRKLNQGRNLNCWPVLSFGWKDADLDPEGCTGIQAIRWKDEEHLLVDVGGHKTFCYSEQEQDMHEGGPEWTYLCEECFGLTCDGDSEEFTASFSDTLEVPQSYTTRRGVKLLSVARTVRRIVKAAEKRCQQFEKRMARISKGLDEITKEEDDGTTPAE